MVAQWAIIHSSVQQLKLCCRNMSDILTEFKMLNWLTLCISSGTSCSLWMLCGIKQSISEVVYLVQLQDIKDKKKQYFLLMSCISNICNETMKRIIVFFLWCAVTGEQQCACPQLFRLTFQLVHSYQQYLPNQFGILSIHYNVSKNSTCCTQIMF